MSDVLFPSAWSFRKGPFSKPFVPLSDEASKLVFDYLEAYLVSGGSTRSPILFQKTCSRGLLENWNIEDLLKESVPFNFFESSILARRPEYFNNAALFSRTPFHPESILYLMARTSFNEPLKSQVFTDKLSKSLEERVTNKEAFVQNIYNLATFSNNEAFVGQMTKLTGISVAPPTPDSIIPRIAVSTDDSSFIKAKYNLNQLPLDWKFHILKFGSNQIIQELVESSSMPVLNAYSINQLLTNYLDIDKDHQFSLVAEYYIKTRAYTSDQISGYFSYALEKRSFTTAQWLLRRYPPDDLRLLDLLNDGKVTDVGLLKLISQNYYSPSEVTLKKLQSCDHLDLKKIS